MNKKEEQGTLIVEKTDESINSGCDVNMDRILNNPEKVEEFLKSAKKRDTSFVGERKKQIELYGNYYPAGLSDEGIIEWANLEIVANEGLNENLRLLKSTTEAKIESDRQAKLAATLAGLSELEKEQLKAMLV